MAVVLKSSAKAFVRLLILLTFSMLLLMNMTTSTEAPSPTGLKTTNMVFYMHHLESGPNKSVVAVAGIEGQRWTVLQFGTVYCGDAPLTRTPDLKSAQVGRARGIYVTAGLDGSDLHTLMSLVFTNKQYNGSTLEIQGANRRFQTYREVSVVSGTGRFRLARGYAVLSTVSVDIPTLNAVIAWNVTVFHY
ncbi:hypothetical protein Tsubulata_012433 [Turnera subulata]|uniref:Dirigent protein n=1 Tax=Turnera subulata TaxID=218843 RepID=A0A9Q0GNX2_9ROSI|nr:hypothetical protein Tsubulata_012433 [Turnera subulata]